MMGGGEERKASFWHSFFRVQRTHMACKHSAGDNVKLKEGWEENENTAGTSSVVLDLLDWNFKLRGGWGGKRSTKNPPLF